MMTEEHKYIEIKLTEHISVATKSLSELMNKLPKIANVISSCFDSGGKLFICGNGGSAADSQHLAAEFVSAFSKKLNRKALPAIALTTDTSILSAFSNDFGFDGIFARQLEAYANPGDIVLVLSTSGNSRNCINAINFAKEHQIISIGFTGLKGILNSIVDFSLQVQSVDTQHIQEIHQVAYHTLVGLIEQEMFSGEK